MFLRTGATIEPSKLGLAARKAAFLGNKASVVFAAHCRASTSPFCLSAAPVDHGISSFAQFTTLSPAAAPSW